MSRYRRKLLRAFVTDSEPAATAALCGGTRGKGVDAVFIDKPFSLEKEATSAENALTDCLGAPNIQTFV